MPSTTVDVGKGPRKWREEEEGIPSGSQAKVLALSRHRVLRGDGT